MRRYLLTKTVCLALGAQAGTAQAQPTVDVEMAILFDASSSALAFQRFDALLAGHIALFRDPGLVPFLQRQGIGSLAVSAYSFGSSGQLPGITRQITTWQIIQTASQARAFADALELAWSQAESRIDGRTPIGSALSWVGAGTAAGADAATMLFQAAGFLGGITPTGIANNNISGTRVILNLVSDGQNAPTNPSGLTPTQGSVAARNAGVNVVNALAALPAGSPGTNATTLRAVTFINTNDIILAQVTNPANREVGFVEFPLFPGEDVFQIICRKFVRELTPGMPASTDTCELLLPDPVDVPLRIPLEYGALTRLGAALFGEMLENQPQRAQRLRGQVAARGPAAVRGEGAPSTAARPEGGIFAAAGLNDGLRYTATGQLAALPAFDFGWGEWGAALDPALTGSTGIWGRPFYSQARMSGGRGVDSYDHIHRGFALGADMRIGRYGLVGVWGGGSSANVGFAGPGGGGPSSASMSSWVAGIYGSAATGSLDTGLWYADITAGYGEQDWSLTRSTLTGGRADGSFRSPALGAYTEAGFAGHWGPVLWQPHLFLRTVQTERPALAERGTDVGVARQVDGATFTSVQAGPGLRVSQALSLGDGISLVPEGRIRWEREYGDNAASVSGAFVLDGSRVPFSGRAPGLDRDALGLGASLKLARLTGGPAGGGFGLDLDWDASLSNDTTAHRLALQLRLAW